MSGQGASFGNVRYDLRPCKQVERLMLIDAFRRLGCAGFPMADYLYVGMGATHFYDYQLFHKYLGIREMVSAEMDQSREKRVKFNKPFEFVRVDMRPIGDVVAEIPKDRRAIVWLDYDAALCSDFLRDFGLALGRLTPGSVVLLTVDIEPPRSLKPGESTLDFYRQRLEEHCPSSWRAPKFGQSAIARTVLELAERTMKVAMNGRRSAGVTFEPFIACTYRDGHRMLSFGGMIATDHEKRQLSLAKLSEESYCRRTLNEDPFEIRVPVLTNRERLYMDSNMPARERWHPKAFNLSEADLAAYKEIYRFTPVFVESIA